MLLRNSAKRSLDIKDLEDSKPDLFECVEQQVERANSDVLPCSIVADCIPGDVVGNALHVSHDRVV